MDVQKYMYLFLIKVRTHLMQPLISTHDDAEAQRGVRFSPSHQVAESETDAKSPDSCSMFFPLHLL